MIIINYKYASSPKKRFVSRSDTVLIGRSSPEQAVDLDLNPDSSVSRCHARLTYENGTFWLEDLNSKSGTWINGQKIPSKTRVASGSTVRMGLTVLDILIPEEGMLTDSVSATMSTFDLLLAKKPDTADYLDEARRRLAAFYELGTALGTFRRVEPLLKSVVKHLCKVIADAQRAVVLLLEEDNLSLKAFLPEDSQPPISLNLARLAIDKQEAFTWRYGTPGKTGQLYDSVIMHGTQAAMYAPLISKDEVLGVVFVENTQARKAFDDDDLRLLMAMANQVAMFVKNYALQQDLRREEIIRSNLLRQFSPQVAERLKNLLYDRKNLRLGGERAEPVTILNLDVRGFTELTAHMEPNDVVEMLNELFGICIPIIFNYNGSVDKYVGDAILAVFGSPEPDEQQWENVVRAALELQHAIYNLGLEREQHGLAVCQVGIGIHTGAVLHGFIGSEERMEYTVIGDAVNRAARYCEAAGPGEIIISEAVYQHVSGLVLAMPKTINSKYPDAETDKSAYLVVGLQESEGELI